MKCMGDVLQYRKQSKFPALWGSILELWDQAARVYSRKVHNPFCSHDSQIEMIRLTLITVVYWKILADIIFFSL